jgi:hypothetical protein
VNASTPSGSDETAASPDLRLDIPHTARVYDYYLGGKTNYATDRELADKTIAQFPDAPTGAKENRLFMHRAARYLAAEAGIRQFLDIGTGIPTSPNLHEIVQAVDPSCRVVYADNDPLVLAHARALMASTPEGVTTYIPADLREPEKLLQSPELHSVLDFTRPIALSIVAVLHFIPDSDDPGAVISQYVDALPSGSYLLISHGTLDVLSAAAVEAALKVYHAAGIRSATRTRAEVEAFFTGLEMVEPGVQPILDWRSDGNHIATSHNQAPIYGGVGHKP